MLDIEWSCYKKHEVPPKITASSYKISQVLTNGMDEQIKNGCQIEIPNHAHDANRSFSDKHANMTRKENYLFSGLFQQLLIGVYPDLNLSPLVKACNAVKFSRLFLSEHQHSKLYAMIHQPVQRRMNTLVMKEQSNV